MSELFMYSFSPSIKNNSLNTKDTTKKKIIAIFCPYPLTGAPSQRFRYEQYLDILQQHEIEYHIFPFIDVYTNAILYRRGHTLQKVIGILKGYFRRIAHIFKARHADYVLLHREASPLGPPVFEWLLAKVWRKKIVYDFDDAIWLSNTSGVNKIVSRLKWHHKVANICRWSYKVSCGNAYLCQYASQFNASVVLNPTTIDTHNLHNQVKNQEADIPVIGWTGSHSTMRFLDEIFPVLQRLSKEYIFRIVIISNQEPGFQLSNLTFIKWQASTEIQDLLNMHIGIMPLTDDLWAKGKCGFKALQYLSLGIPAVVSPVGVNSEIVEHGINGYLCSGENEWYEALATLISNVSLRIRMGKAGRRKIEEKYSVKANKENFLTLFT